MLLFVSLFNLNTVVKYSHVKKKVFGSRHLKQLFSVGLYRLTSLRRNSGPLFSATFLEIIEVCGHFI